MSDEVISSLDDKLLTRDELRNLGFKLMGRRVVGLQVFEREDYTFLFNKVVEGYELVLSYKIEEYHPRGGRG